MGGENVQQAGEMIINNIFVTLHSIKTVDPLQMTDKDKEKEESWRTGKENCVISFD